MKTSCKFVTSPDILVTKEKKKFMNATVMVTISSPDTTYFKTTTTSQWHNDAEFLDLPEKTANLWKQTEMFLAMHGLSRSTSADSRAQLWNKNKINDMLKMQQADGQRKIMEITIIIESACKIYDINVWERIKSLLL